MSLSNVDDPIVSLIDTYHSLNAAVVDELDSEPSALEFMRYVAANRPFVVRGAAANWTAVQKWDLDYLKEKMTCEDVRVAVTPFGNADAVVDTDGQSPMFVEPWETVENFSGFLDSILPDASPTASTPTNADQSATNVKYAQPQNDSLRNEYPSLTADVPQDIPFARIALQKHADAMNIWLGNDRSVTSLHKDNYENLYIQVRGRKQFVLLPPIEMPCVNERELLKARYAPAHKCKTEYYDVSTVPLKIIPDEEEQHVPVPTWDPDHPTLNATKYSHLSRPLRVTLRKGDMLYLPAMWYHKVSQSAGNEGFVCAVNYWYDMEFAGSFWTGMNFVREVVEKEVKRKVDDADSTMDIC